MTSVAERLRAKRQKPRTMVTVTFQVPEYVIKDLKDVAATKGFLSYQGMMRVYVGKGLRWPAKR
jgi:hypothetical protein